jgi:hypothetical protein
MTTPANYIVPPVQPIQQPKINLPGQGGQGQPQQPGQEQPGQGQDESSVHHLMILIGALTEALVANGVLSEEDIHNAIARLEVGQGEEMDEEEEDEDEEPQANRSQPKPKASGSHGYPGAADTEKGMGNEWGKNQR